LRRVIADSLPCDERGAERDGVLWVRIDGDGATGVARYLFGHERDTRATTDEKDAAHIIHFEAGRTHGAIEHVQRLADARTDRVFELGEVVGVAFEESLDHRLEVLARTFRRAFGPAMVPLHHGDADGHHLLPVQDAVREARR